MNKRDTAFMWLGSAVTLAILSAPGVSLVPVPIFGAVAVFGVGLGLILGPVGDRK